MSSAKKSLADVLAMTMVIKIDSDGRSPLRRNLSPDVLAMTMVIKIDSDGRKFVAVLLYVLLKVAQYVHNSLEMD